MKVLVSDTSVLIDLDRGTLVEPTFRLPFEFTVPDLLYECELSEHGGPDFVRLGLASRNWMAMGGSGVSAWTRGKHQNPWGQTARPPSV